MTPRAAPMSPDERRRAIVEAVTPVLFAQGPDITTREIATAAGVAEGTLFRVFENKQELLLEACWQIMRPEGVATWLGRVDSSGGLEHTVHQVVETMADGVERMGQVLTAVRMLGARQHNGGPSARHLPDARRLEALGESNRVMVERLADLLRPFSAQLRVPPERAALVLRSLVYGAFQRGLDAPQRLTSDEIADVVLCGIVQEVA